VEQDDRSLDELLQKQIGKRIEVTHRHPLSSPIRISISLRSCPDLVPVPVLVAVPSSHLLDFSATTGVLVGVTQTHVLVRRTSVIAEDQHDIAMVEKAGASFYFPDLKPEVLAVSPSTYLYLHTYLDLHL
jgi:hypothetical protein